jgi:hypothetical protein
MAGLRAGRPNKFQSTNDRITQRLLALPLSPKGIGIGEILGYWDFGNYLIIGARYLEFISKVDDWTWAIF